MITSTNHRLFFPFFNNRQLLNWPSSICCNMEHFTLYQLCVTKRSRPLIWISNKLVNLQREITVSTTTTKKHLSMMQNDTNVPNSRHSPCEKIPRQLVKRWALECNKVGEELKSCSDGSSFLRSSIGKGIEIEPNNNNCSVREEGTVKSRCLPFHAACCWNARTTASQLV